VLFPSWKKIGWGLGVLGKNEMTPAMMVRMIPLKAGPENHLRKLLAFQLGALKG